MENLPDHLLIEIFSHFSPQFLATNLALVCHRCYQLAFSPCLWSRLRLNIRDLGMCQVELQSLLSKISSGLHSLELSVRENLRPAIFSTLPELPNLTRLNFGFNTGIDPALVDFLVEICPGVEAANFEGSKEFNDSCLSTLSAGWRNLSELNISHCTSVSDAGLIDFINSVICIKSLNVDGIPHISDSAVDILAVRHGSSLRSIWLDGDNLTDLAIFSLSSQALLLAELSISFASDLTDSSIAYLKRFAHLRHLHIKKGLNLSSSGLDEIFSLSSFTQLHFLSLYECGGLTDTSVDSLTANCPLLKSLCLSWCWLVTDVGVNLIVERCRNLLILSLIGMKEITGRMFASVPQVNLPKLRFLDLTQCNKVVDEILEEMIRRSNVLIVRNYYGERFKGVQGEIVSLDYGETKDLVEAVEGYCCLRSTY